MSILDTGYQPTDKLDQSKPPEGGSAVGVKPTITGLMSERARILDLINYKIGLIEYMAGNKTPEGDALKNLKKEIIDGIDRR